MSAYSPEFTVNDLAGLAPRWDKLIAADLVKEVENDTADRVETIDEMRLFLAIKGYRQMFDLLTTETAGKTGAAALRAIAVASRGYAKERPGLSAATFRCPMVESPEWLAAFVAVRRLFEKAFAECGLDDMATAHALRFAASCGASSSTRCRVRPPRQRISTSLSTSGWTFFLEVCWHCCGSSAAPSIDAGRALFRP
jgi:hypothetical protein